MARLKGGSMSESLDQTALSDEQALSERLRNSGIRPTRQRVALAELLFDGADKHVSAEQLHALAHQTSEHVSLATVYNTLKQFSAAGLVREVATPCQKIYFDTNTSDHHHYFIESNGHIVDIDEASVSINGLPDAPLGKKVGRVDIIVHLVDETDDEGCISISPSN